ncbi:hypothetical protein V537_02694, partial [Staphylococcus aureus F91072]
KDVNLLIVYVDDVDVDVTLSMFLVIIKFTSFTLSI